MRYSLETSRHETTLGNELALHSILVANKALSHGPLGYNFSAWVHDAGLQSEAFMKSHKAYPDG